MRISQKQQKWVLRTQLALGPLSLSRLVLKTWCGELERAEARASSSPVDALGNQAGGGQGFFDMSQPIGGLKLAEPPVHVLGLIIAGLHHTDQALLQDVVPGHQGGITESS